MEKPAEEQVMFNSSMSDNDFFKWLRSRGVSDKDCKILSGKMHYTMSLLLLSDNVMFPFREWCDSFGFYSI